MSFYTPGNIKEPLAFWRLQEKVEMEQRHEMGW